MEKEDPLRQQLIDRRCQSANEVAAWVMAVAKSSGPGGQCEHRGQGFEQSTVSTKSTLSTRTYPEISANAALVLLAVACALLDR